VPAARLLPLDVLIVIRRAAEAIMLDVEPIVGDRTRLTPLSGCVPFIDNTSANRWLMHMAILVSVRPCGNACFVTPCHAPFRSRASSSKSGHDPVELVSRLSESPSFDNRVCNEFVRRTEIPRFEKNAI